MRTALFCDVTQQVMVITYRLWGSVGCPETSVRNYHYLLRNVTEQRSSKCFSCFESAFLMFYVSSSCFMSEFLCAFRKIAKSDCWLRRVCPSVRQHGKTRLPLDGFSRNMLFLYFFLNIFLKIQVSLKSAKNDWYFT